MAIALVQSATNSGSGSSLTVTLGSGTTTGRLFVVATAVNNNGSFPGTPTITGATTALIQGMSVNVNGYNYMWEIYNVPNGTTSITNTTGASGAYSYTLSVLEFSGLAVGSVSAVDNSGTVYSGSSSLVQSAAMSPSAANELWLFSGLFGFSTYPSVTGPQSPFTGVVTFPDFGGIGYYVSTNSASYTSYYYNSSPFLGAAGGVTALLKPLLPISGTGSTSASFSASATGTLILAPGGFVLPTFSANATGVLNIASTGSLAGSFSASAFRYSTQIKSLPTLSVQIAFNPTNIQSLTQTWVDVSQYVRDFQTKIGRQHFLDRVEAGTLSMSVSNRNGFFLNGAVNGTGYVVQPRLPIQVTATWNSVTYPIFYGIIDDIEEKITDQLNSDLSIRATDLIKFLSLRYMASTNFWSQYASVSSTINWYRCTSAKNAIVTGASWTGGSYVTYAAVNNFSSGDNVTITGLGAGTGSSLNLNNYTIVSATSSSFTVNNPGGLTNPSVSSGNGTVYNTTLIDQNSGYAGSYYDQLVSFPPNGAMVYTNDGCVDLTNGSNVSSGNIIFGTAGSPYGIDFWVLGQGISGATNLLTVLYRKSSGIATTLYLGATTTGLLQAGTATTGATTWTTISSNPISDGYWHHIGCYISGTTLYIYVDGTTTSFDTTQSGVAFTASNTISGACYVDEIIVSNSSISFNDLQNRYTAGTLLTQGFPVTANQVLSGDRIAEILCIAGFGTISGGQVVLNSNTYFINDSATAWVNGASGNGFTSVEPYYWDSPVTGSTALDLILQICDTDIGSFYQEPNGTFSFYNQNYYGTWSWYGSSGSWSPNSYSPSSDHVWTDDTSSTYHYYGPSLQVLRDDVDTWTTVKVSPQSGTEQVYENTANESRWGYSTLTKSSTLHTALNLALSTANFLGNLFKSPLPRIGNVELRSETSNGANMTALLNTEFGDVVTFRRNSPNSSTSGTYPSTQGYINTNMVVESISHDFQADPGFWHTSFILDPYPIRS